MIPDKITLSACGTCGRTDRWQPLRTGHYHNGKRCPGAVWELTYVRESIPNRIPDSNPPNDSGDV